MMGTIEGLFISEESKVKESIGKGVYFGEILGKHSGVFGKLYEEDLVVKSENQKFIQSLEDLLGETISGYNPLEYIDEE